jgi:hypothetical protein
MSEGERLCVSDVRFRVDWKEGTIGRTARCVDVLEALLVWFESGGVQWPQV